MTDIIFRVVEVGGRDGAGTDGFVCVSVNLDLEKKTLKTFSHIFDNDRVWTIVWYSSFWSEESINTPNSKLVLNLVPRDLDQLILCRCVSERTNKQTKKP